MARLARIALLAVLLALPTAALAGSGSQVLAPNCNTAQFKPEKILISCGDGNNYLKNLSWSGWSTTLASGKGINEVNDCKPSCVAGKFHAFPAKVTLSQPKHCGRVKGHRVFGQIKLVFTDKSPGKSKRATSSLACPT